VQEEIQWETSTVSEADNTVRVPHQYDHANVLICDDEQDTARLLLAILARKGIGARVATNKKATLDSLAKGGCDLAFLGTRLGGPSHRARVFELLKAIRATAPELPVVMMAGLDGTTDGEPLYRLGTETAVRAIQAGCSDFLLKPLRQEPVERLLEALLPNRPVATAAAAQEGDRWLYQLVGESPKLIQTVDLAERIAPTSVPVLISGDSGTGKELIARLIHHKSKRSLGPFVRVNCAALNDSLLESELFGHEKGAFTGAHAQRPGRFERAHGGTLLLDEISETPPSFQAKLLRILEQQEFERVGGSESIRVNVRIISTTNRDLPHEIQLGRFRQDLYYRLSTARIVLAPLRERREDLPDLVWHFVNLYARETQRHIETLDPAMMDIFAEYSWPGNVRQLRNVVLTSLILGVGPTLSLADVSWLFDELQPRTQHNPNRRMTASPGEPFPDADNPAGQSRVGGRALADLEKQAILETLRQTSGNQTRAAKVLGISDRTLREKMRRYREQERLEPEPV
jgi:DNA-binding NtrC family response regulator